MLAATVAVSLVPDTIARPLTSEAQRAGLVSGCSKQFHQKKAIRYIRGVYLKRENVNPRAKTRIRRMILCQHSAEARRNVRIARRHIKKRRARMLSLTPYDCGPHGRFAIPCYIVACESGFNWEAQNPSGAYGAYQLLGWVPIPSPRSVQHSMAAKLWAGGSGASHWVCA